MVSKQQEKKIWIKLKEIEEEIKDLKLSEEKRRAKIARKNKNIRFPEKINLLGNVWKIELSKDLKDSDDKRIGGLCTWRKRIISLDLSSENIIENLLHEVQHAIDYEFGNAFDELRKLKGNKHFNEFRVSTLAKIWLSVFKQLRGEVKNAI